MEPTDPIPRRLWRVAGMLVLAYVASFAASIAIIGAPTVHEGRSSTIEHSWSEAELGRSMTGGYVLLLGYCCLVAAMVFLARSVGRITPNGRWASASALAAGVVYVAVILAGGFAPGAAALWGRDNGTDLATLLTVNDIRNFAYFVALPVMGMYVLAVAAAALSDRVLTRWTGRFGVVVGVALLLAVPAAAYGVQYGMPLWLLWWLGVGISLLRHRPVEQPHPVVDEPVATAPGRTV